MTIEYNVGFSEPMNQARLLQLRRAPPSGIFMTRIDNTYWWICPACGGASAKSWLAFILGVNDQFTEILFEANL